MKSLYLTADRLGEVSGGGSVTRRERDALAEFSGDCATLSREELEASCRGVDYPRRADPWHWDDLAYHLFGGGVRLLHAYAGTFSNCVEKAKRHGAKVSYTCAAHSVEESRKEFESLGFPFDLPHLTNPRLWAEYSRGYREADVLVVPSTYSERVVRSYGMTRVRVIPHGVDLPPGERLKPPPGHFTVGTLGAVAGPDKGLRYLLEAWKRLDYPDATLLVAGKHSTTRTVRDMLRVFGGGDVRLVGWVDDVTDFYNGLSLYVQPSVTEGFGMEVTEAMAHARPVVCSSGAGAADHVTASCGRLVPPRDVGQLCDAIDFMKKHASSVRPAGECGRRRVIEAGLTWPDVMRKYKDLWKELTDES